MPHSVIHFVKLQNRKGKQNANRTNSLDPRKSLDLRASLQVRNQCTLGIALWQSDLSEANFDRLIDGAIGAAQISYSAIGNTSPELALLISCVGRKLVSSNVSKRKWKGYKMISGEKPFSLVSILTEKFLHSLPLRSASDTTK